MTNQGLSNENPSLFPRTARILIVDDESLIAETIEIALIEEGYDVTVRTNGRDALSLLLQDDISDDSSSVSKDNPNGVSKNFDLLILDLMLPGINGLDICRLIRQRGIQCPHLDFECSK